MLPHRSAILPSAIRKIVSERFFTSLALCAPVYPLCKLNDLSIKYKCIVWNCRYNELVCPYGLTYEKEAGHAQQIEQQGNEGVYPHTRRPVREANDQPNQIDQRQQHA
jgi:hypothetical protein